MKKLSLLAIAFLVFGCGPDKDDTGEDRVDADGDGYYSDVDCNDEDFYINPSANEVCADGLDNNCDGLVDDGSAVNAQTWYPDADRDGYGDSEQGLSACEQPQGYVFIDGDCDDASVLFHPGASETDCEDPNDYNCDGSVGYDDKDKDGYAACMECDDSDASRNPGEPEVCGDDVDNDCDLLVDEDDAIDAVTWYLDYDRDGFGTDEYVTTACEAPRGYVAESGDCNDRDAATFPGAGELCDEQDNDCDLEVDEDALDAPFWYPDADLDGYGTPGDTLVQCDAPEGYSAFDTDCDDANAAINPGASEFCNEIDDDCDGEIDEAGALDASRWFQDGDEDGYGGESVEIMACSPPDGYVDNRSDCDDTDPAVSPGASEYCNAIDDNCNGAIDENTAVDAPTWYIDYDHDNYGSPAVSWVSCVMPANFADNADDCDDLRPTIYPGANEYCDGVDTDCDGVLDEDDAIDAVAWYRDGDTDGYGDPKSALTQCYQPTGYVANSRDCDDTLLSVSPSALEYCNGVDDDCDGVVDEASSVDARNWYVDLDSDNYGSGASILLQCYQPIGYVASAGDCNDALATVNPGAIETCNSVDDNCNGVVDDAASDASTWYLDYDGDGHGSPYSSAIACTAPSGYVASSDDCNDLSAVAFPGGVEVCDSVDNDCNGTIDEPTALDATTWYRDADADNYGDASISVVQCTRPTGYVSVGTDCDDTRNTVYPRATEYCNGLDDNCDGTVDEDTAVGTVFWYPDADGDGYGNTTGAVKACDNPGGYGLVVGDCNDSNPAINPSATEVCDFQDNDCNGTVDDAYAADAGTWYRDLDTDGYGNLASTLRACTRPSGYVSDSTDCDDSSSSVNPGVDEICNNETDDDCDGTPDHCTMSLNTLADAIFTGVDANDLAGLVEHVGDLDNDGVDDLMISAQYGGSGTDAGQVYLFYGPIDERGTVSLSEADVIMTGSSSIERAGNAFAAGVDLNADGYGDFVVGAWKYQSGTIADAGRAYVLYGPLTSDATLGDASTVATIRGDSAFDRLGSAVAMLEDANGDGLGDLAFGVYTDDRGSLSNNGAVFLQNSPVSGSYVISSMSNYLYGESAEDRIGEKIRGNLDINGDGLSDLLVGVYLEDSAGSSAGAVYTVYSPVTGARNINSADSKLLGSSASDQAGTGLYSAGDFNSDGYDDFLVGAPFNDTTGADAGAVYLILGPPPASGSLASAAHAIIYGESSSGKLGTSVCGDADFDGDGQNDLLLGGSSAGALLAGSAYLLNGPVSGTMNISGYDARMTGGTGGDEVGSVVRQVGDVDGSGLPSIGITGSRVDLSATDAGAMFLVLGVGL